MSNHVFGKCIFSRCDKSCMGTKIHLLHGRHIIRFATGDKRHPTTLYRSLLRPILVNAAKTKVSEIIAAVPHDSNIFIVTALYN